MAGKVAGHKGPGFGSFKGRAGRGEWWSSLIWNSVIGGGVAVVPGIGAVLSLPWIVGLLAATTRRLHDLKRSGWWQLAPIAVGALAFGLYVYARNAGRTHFTVPEEWTAAAFSVAALAYLGFYAWIGLAAAKPGPNCYGEADA
jgi:uncharacterized membrane protein YhaH (DUF805 family)